VYDSLSGSVLIYWSIEWDAFITVAWQC
jgi:hypothetical protein